MEKQAEKGKNHWPLIGNEHIIRFLEAGVAHDKVAGSYIFSGPDDLGKTTTARFFAKSLLCSEKQPGAFNIPCGSCSSCRQMGAGQENDGQLGAGALDYRLIGRPDDKKNIGIEQVRDLIRELSMSSFDDSYKVAVIKNAETLSLEASNALLKTLEEPRRKVIVILIASNLDNLPDTIISRSQVLNFYPVKSELIHDHLIEKYQVNRSLAKNISRLALGRPALAVKFLKDNDFFTEHIRRAETFLEILRLDLNGRSGKVADLLSESEAGQEAVRSSLVILSVWRAVLRDMLLHISGNHNLIQHEIIREKIATSLNGFNAGRILSIVRSFKNSEEQIKANVNPKLVLENLVFSI